MKYDLQLPDGRVLYLEDETVGALPRTGELVTFQDRVYNVRQVRWEIDALPSSTRNGASAVVILGPTD